MLCDTGWYVCIIRHRLICILMLEVGVYMVRLQMSRDACSGGTVCFLLIIIIMAAIRIVSNIVE